MRLQTPISILILMILLIPIAIADYEFIGGNSDYTVGFGIWNQLAQEGFTTSGNVLIDVATHVPIISDLDDDGVKEIIVIDDDILLIYRGINLDVVDSIVIVNSATATTYDNLQAFDIDDDGNKEILFAYQRTADSSDISVYDFENDTLSLKATHNIPSAQGQIKFGCYDEVGALGRLCGGLYTEFRDKGVNRDVNRFCFNDTSFICSPSEVFPQPNGLTCFSNHDRANVFDYDNDGNDEMLFTVFDGDAGGEDTLKIVILNENFGVEQIITTDDDSILIDDQIADYVDNTPQDCETEPIMSSFSQPLVGDFDFGLPANEIVVAYQIQETECVTSDNCFVMKMYRSDGNFEDRFPELEVSEGDLISNLYRGDVFSSTGNVDFCAVGFDNVSDLIVINCGSPSENNPLFPETLEFTYEHEGSFDLSAIYNFPNTLVHGSDQSRETKTGTHNPDEVITSFGVFTHDTSTCSFLGNCDAELIFTNPQPNGVVILDDYQGDGTTDMIIMTQTNLFYLNDGFINEGGFINGYQINPCLEATWKQNTTLSVTIRPIDEEGDQVRARAILYFDDPKEQDSNYSAFLPSGTVIPITNLFPTEIGSGTLRLMATDEVNPDDPDIIDLGFTIGAAGVEFNDCVTTVTDIGVEDEDEDDTGIIGLDRDDNTIRNTLVTVDEDLGLNLGVTVLWLLIVGIIIWGVWTELKPSLEVGVGLTFAIIIGGIIIGGILGFISLGLIITLVIFAIIIIFAFVSNWFTLGKGNGNG